MRSRAAVQHGDRQIDIEELEVPDRLGPDEALLRVEGCGMCGSDYEQYVGRFAGTGLVEYPVVPGHEPVGRIEWIGEEAKSRWRVDVGDRVAVEPFAPCGVCPGCSRGRYRLCTRQRTYGFVRTDVGSGLWGGFADYMVLQGNTFLHRVPEELSIEDAVLYNPLGAGFEWALRTGGVGPGDSVLILGAGQRGLACVAASVVAGAGRIAVTGLPRDAHKLALAEQYGAAHAVAVGDDPLPEQLNDLTGGVRFDVVIDLTPHATAPVADALRLVARGGTVVLAGIKGMAEIPGFVSDRIVLDELVVRGAQGVTSWSYEQALSTIVSGRFDLSPWHTHTVPLERLEEGLKVQGGETPDETPLHVTVVTSGS